MEAQDPDFNTAIDLTAALAGNIPYVGGAIGVMLSLYKKPDVFISWDDIQKYVDEKIEEQITQDHIQEVHNSMVINYGKLQTYLDNDGDSLSTLEIIYDDVFDLNSRVLGKEGFDVEGTGALTSGYWKKSPWAVQGIVGQLLVLTFTILTEMKSIADANSTPKLKMVQAYINKNLAAFRRASQLNLFATYWDRMKMLRLEKDYIKSETYLIDGNNYYTYKCSFKWKDTAAPDNSDKYYKEKTFTSSLFTNVDDEIRKFKYEQNTVMSVKRKEYLNYRFKLHPTVTQTMYENIVGPLDNLLSLDTDLSEDSNNYQNECDLRNKRGTVYNGIKIQYSQDGKSKEYTVYGNLLNFLFIDGSESEALQVESNLYKGASMQLVSGPWQDNKFKAYKPYGKVSWDKAKAMKGELKTTYSGFKIDPVSGNFISEVIADISWKMPEMPPPPEIEVPNPFS